MLVRVIEVCEKLCLEGETILSDVVTAQDGHRCLTVPETTCQVLKEGRTRCVPTFRDGDGDEMNTW
jgi:hypothetical protein